MVVILSFVLPHEAHMAKSILESEGVEVNLKDELTAQVYNFYSNAIGGIKLLVKEEDRDIAYKILVDAGYIKEPEVKSNAFLLWFDKFSSKLPLIGKSILEIRLVVFCFLLIVLIILIILLIDHLL